MLDYKELLYFYISLVYFLLLLNNAGLQDYSAAPAHFSYCLLFIFGLFFYFGKHRFNTSVSLFIFRLNLFNLILYGCIVLLSYCIEISYIELSKYLTAALLFITIYYSVFNGKDLRLFIKIFTCFIEIYVIITMAYYFYFKYAAGAFFSGICYTMFYPYYYATLVICVAPLSLFLYFTSDKKARYERANFIILFFLCCISVFLTSSRVAQITLFICVSVILFYFSRFDEFKLRAGVIAIIFLAALIIGGLTATDAFTRIAKSFTVKENFDLYDENGRLNIYKAAIKVFFDRPFFGVGPALSSMFITKYRVSKLCITDCHNIILNRLCETGIFYSIFSFFTIIATIFITIKYAAGAANKTLIKHENISGDITAHASAAGAVSLAAVYMQGFSMPHTFLTALIFLEYIIIAICCAAMKTGRLVIAPAAVSSCGADPIEFSFTKINMRICSIISFLLFINILLIVLSGDKIVFFIQWLLNMAFLFICVSIFFIASPIKLMDELKTNIIFKACAAALITSQLYAQWNIFESGVWFRTGLEHSAMTRTSEAAVCYEKSVQHYTNMASYLFLSASYYKLGRYNEALNAAVFYNSKLPYEIFGLNNLASCLDECGDKLRARKTYDLLDSCSAKNYMSAVNGAFLINEGDIKTGIYKFMASALENNEFLSGKLFCSKILINEKFSQKIISSLAANADALYKYNEKFSAYYFYRIAHALAALYKYGYKPDDYFNSDVIHKAEKVYLGELNKNFIEMIKNIFSNRNYYKTYDLFKRHVVKSSLNYSAHFGLKHWFNFENALIDKYGVYEPAPPPPFISIFILRYICKEKYSIKYTADYYKNFYHE